MVGSPDPRLPTANCEINVHLALLMKGCLRWAAAHLARVRHHETGQGYRAQQIEATTLAYCKYTQSPDLAAPY